MHDIITTNSDGKTFTVLEDMIETPVGARLGMPTLVIVDEYGCYSKTDSIMADIDEMNRID